jgi:hypothetical protein
LRRHANAPPSSCHVTERTSGACFCSAVGSDAVLIGASNLRADDPDLLPSHLRVVEIPDGRILSVERVVDELFLGYAFDWMK